MLFLACSYSIVYKRILVSYVVFGTIKLFTCSNFSVAPCKVIALNWKLERVIEVYRPTEFNIAIVMFLEINNLFRTLLCLFDAQILFSKNLYRLGSKAGVYYICMSQENSD